MGESRLLDRQALLPLLKEADSDTLTDDLLQQALAKLYYFTLPHLEGLINDPLGVMILSLVVRRSNPALFERVVTDLTPHYRPMATTACSGIVLLIINRLPDQKVLFLVNQFIGHFDSLLSNAVGMVVVDALWHRTPQGERGRILCDFYGRAGKGRVLSFREIVNANATARKDATNALLTNLRTVSSVGAGKYELTQTLLFILVQEMPRFLPRFVCYLKDFGFGSIGSELMIGAIAQSSQADLHSIVASLEDANTSVAGDDTVQRLYLPRTMAGKLAADDYGWRVLTCAISFLDDPMIVISRVLPNLMVDWRPLSKFATALQFFVRLVSLKPSVFRGIDFQRQELNATLAQEAISLLTPLVLDEATTFGLTKDGRNLIVTIMGLARDTKTFSHFRNAVFAEANFCHPKLTKLVRAVVAARLVDPLFVRDKLDKVGMEAVLSSSGAWIVADLVTHDGEFRASVLELINTAGFTGEAIDFIQTPVDNLEIDRLKPFKFKTTVSNVAYCITVGATGFSAQADHINGIQWLLLLRQQRVPLKNLFLFLPQDPGVTVTNPCPHLGLPPLEIPDDLNTRVFTGVDIVTLLGHQLGNFGDNSSIDRIVWIFLNHGNPHGLCFPHEEMGIGNIFGLYNCVRKPMLVVLDACCSSHLVDEMYNSRKSLHGWGYLTTGPNACYTSAIVISDQTMLLHRYNSKTEGPLEYSIYNSMFTRCLMHLIAYSDVDPTLADLPTLLDSRNDGRNGFIPKFDTDDHRMAERHLRNFFPGPINPDDLMIGRDIPFRQIVPAEPIGLLFDDLCRFWDGTPDKSRFAFHFVKISTVGERVTIEKDGVLPKGKTALGKIRQSIVSFRGKKEAPLPVHVPVDLIVDAVEEKLNDDKSPAAYMLSASMKSPVFMEVEQFLEAVNQVFPPEIPSVGTLTALTVNLPQVERLQRIAAARRKVAMELKIEIEDQPVTDRAVVLFCQSQGRSGE
jgi:hypothetical protein